MTIKVTKPSINLREKLSELDFDKVPFQKMPAGSVLQVVQGSTSTYVVNSSTSHAVTGLEATITPTSVTSKVLVMVEQQGCKASTGSSGDINMRLQRNASDVHKFALGYFYSNTNEFRAGISTTYLDAPSSTASTTYRTTFQPNDGGTCYVQNDGANTVSTITLMEIAQ